MLFLRNETNPLRVLILLSGVMVSIAFIVFGIVVWQDVKESQSTRLAEQHDMLQQRAVDFLSQQTRIVARTLAEIDQLGQIVPTELKADLSYLITANDNISALLIMDRTGSVVTAVSQADTPSLSVENRQQFEMARLDKSVQIGTVQRSGILAPPQLPLFIPLLDDKKQVSYIAAVFLVLDQNVGLLNQLAIAQNQRLWFVGREGQLHLTYPLDKGLVAGLFRQRFPDEALRAVQASVVENPRLELEISGQTYLLQSGYIADYQLLLLQGQPITSLISVWAGQMRPVTGVFLLFLLAGFGVFWFTSRISQKVTAAKEEAEGNVEKLSQAVEQSPSSIVITDANWLIDYANSHFDLEQNASGLQRHVIGQEMINFSPYSELKADLMFIAEEVSQTGKWFAERQTEFNGHWYAFSISGISNSDGVITHFVTVVNDITKRKRDEEKLYQQANYDSLTGLPNRLRGNQDLARALQTAWHDQSKIAVLYLDIDNFKMVNDTFGHLMGDQLLQLVADRLRSVCSDRAYVCHVSGDEFMVFTTYKEKPEVQLLADKILRDVETPVEIEGKLLYVSVSIGIACYPDDNNDVSGLIKFSDIALYESKKQGRKRYSFFTSELEYGLKRRSEVENLLRQALARGEIYMVYQSKNCIKTGQILGFEALMRWQSADLGFVGPDEFIHAAEEVGLINELGEFALEQACSDLVVLQQKAPRRLNMAVNLSLRQLAQDDIVFKVRDVLEKTPIEPMQLELEITESLLADNVESLMPRLEKLLALGASLTIDDFGTGYSSLSYLTRFPVSCLKVDRAFVRDMANHAGDATLARTIIAMAHALNLKVVAEGIEDEIQLEMLRQYRCDIGQGYFFSKPVHLEEALRLLERDANQEHLFET
ncbi:EAL domain-containing protein [Neptuniibacter sp. CAU 1671]|uniref:putative bifunctional diguanylate cyclase/phosphodiesterase n=1 Tax=Neptuniibacter sp. CAU 1671 TaxID=3032593 RepID=UPI0023DC8B2D|nr:EAL domain-containing protein [Neptuniibacter sp. CAU 1671]MDF2181708.1 EAL domain-containing protein [Neptuniibacter sp. CAU 1671]